MNSDGQAELIKERIKRETTKADSGHLRRYLTDNDQTQAQIAKEVGVTTNAINTWCNGETMPYWLMVYLMTKIQLKAAESKKEDRILMVIGAEEKLAPVEAICAQMGVTALKVKGGDE